MESALIKQYNSKCYKKKNRINFGSNKMKNYPSFSRHYICIKWLIGWKEKETIRYKRKLPHYSHQIDMIFIKIWLK